MSRSTTIVRLLALLAAAAIAPDSRADGEAGRCYNEWSEAALIVQRQSLTPVRDLHAEARRRNLGDIVKVTLCTDPQGYVYRLLVREPAGRVVTLVVNAETPFRP